MVTKLIPNVTVGRVPGSIVMSPRCQTGDGKIAGSPFLAVVVPTNHPCVPRDNFPPSSSVSIFTPGWKGASGGLDGIIIDLLAARNWGKEICHQDKKAKRGESG